LQILNGDSSDAEVPEFCWSSKFVGIHYVSYI
jgi:hypothetical protein